MNVFKGVQVYPNGSELNLAGFRRHKMCRPELSPALFLVGLTMLYFDL